MVVAIESERAGGPVEVVCALDDGDVRGRSVCETCRLSGLPSVLVFVDVAAACFAMACGG